MTQKERFVEYMRKLPRSAKTIKKYSEDVPNNLEVQRIIARHTGSINMYDVQNTVLLERIWKEIRELDFDFRGNSMYSCGLKMYQKFLVSINADL